MPETGIGFHPDVGGAYFLPRLAGEIGTWMGLTGARLKAADCILTGVATHYVPSDQRQALIDALEGTALDHDGEAVEALLERFSGDAGPSDLSLTRALIDSAFAGDNVDAMAARLDAAGDAWSLRQLDSLRAKSPTACQVTLADLRRRADLGFREVMSQDLRVSMRCLNEGSDFYEGVRAVILDKDNAPNWARAAGDVSPWFAPLPGDDEMSFLDG